jgi:hypothetical protein
MKLMILHVTGPPGSTLKAMDVAEKAFPKYHHILLMENKNLPVGGGYKKIL